MVRSYSIRSVADALRARKADLWSFWAQRASFETSSPCRLCRSSCASPATVTGRKTVHVDLPPPPNFEFAGPTGVSDPQHLSTYPTYLFYFSTYQLCFCYLLGVALLLVSLIYVIPGSRFRPCKGGGRISQPPKSDFLTTLEFNQISDSKFDASEVTFGALWSSKSITFRTLKSTFHENGDLKDI